MPDTPYQKRPAKRKDADGHLQVGSNWETLIERQIREAMADGKFNDLPYHGQPLPKTDNPYAGDQALAFSILKNAGVAPPWIEADKLRRELMAKREAILERAATGISPSVFARRRDLAELESLVGQINAMITRVNAEAPSTLVRRVPLRLADELERYEQACLRA